MHDVALMDDATLPAPDPPMTPAARLDDIAAIFAEGSVGPARAAARARSSLATRSLMAMRSPQRGDCLNG